MPLFDFVCTACAKNFEAIAKLTDRLTLCPHCHSPRTKRLLSLSATSVGKENDFGSEQTPTTSPAACDHHHTTPTSKPSNCGNSYVRDILQKHRR